mmetsp:Transcript_13950/g.39711  ORF Transcript_13950/g.39711 Transcript_13950/m.39711 type:complete len:241 (+) Transcript_13950:89-811(+)
MLRPRAPDAARAVPLLERVLGGLGVVHGAPRFERELVALLGLHRLEVGAPLEALEAQEVDALGIGHLFGAVDVLGVTPHVWDGPGRTEPDSLLAGEFPRVRRSTSMAILLHRRQGLDRAPAGTPGAHTGRLPVGGHRVRVAQELPVRRVAVRPLLAPLPVPPLALEVLALALVPPGEAATGWRSSAELRGGCALLLRGGRRRRRRGASPEEEPVRHGVLEARCCGHRTQAGARRHHARRR